MCTHKQVTRDNLYHLQLGLIFWPHRHVVLGELTTYLWRLIISKWSRLRPMYLHSIECKIHTLKCKTRDYQRNLSFKVTSVKDYGILPFSLPSAIWMRVFEVLMNSNASQRDLDLWHWYLCVLLKMWNFMSMLNTISLNSGSGIQESGFFFFFL